MKKTALLFVLLISINLSAQQIVEKIFSFGSGDRVSDLTKLENGNLLMIANWELYLFLSDNGDSTSSTTVNYLPHSVVQIDSFYFEAGTGAISGGTLTKRDQDFNFMLGKEFGQVGTASASVGRVHKTISESNLRIDDFHKKSYFGGNFNFLKRSDA